MRAKRWQQIEILFYTALERDEAQRADFLAQSCSDQEMREEVEILLACHNKNKSFLENPPLEQSVSLLATRQNQLSFGQRIGSYQVLKLIGAGGMGEVYLAEDTRLVRKIALKVLSPEFVSVANLVRRFQQEARAASALNHPNILTIYEIGQENSIHYIAAEYVDGLTLRHMISDKQTSLGDILDVALQVTSALSAAHRAGIVHRDIKPQNVMRRHDGYVKVLDFGIAKLIEGQFQNEKLKVLPDTATGTILGTATYMSPEQARGLAVDHRSDIWSLGVTLYEMVTRQIPFKGQTTSDVIVSILEREPLSLAQLAPVAPRELDAIIKRCLTKDLDSRYQNAEELGRDLRNLQQQTELSGEATQLLSGENKDGKIPFSPNVARRYHPAGLSVTQKQPTGLKTKKGFSAHWIQFGRLHSILTVVLLCFLIGIFAVYNQPNGLHHMNSLWSNNLSKSFQLDKINRLTTSGNVRYANVSPDGKYVAYVIQEADQQSLWIRQTTAPPSKMIFPSSGNFYKGLTFSPDSNFIYFVLHEKSKGMGVLYAVSTLGGDPRKILEDVDSPITFSPDGKNFAFVRGFDINEGRAAALMIANLDGSSEKRIAVRNEPDSYSREGLAWSPDGKSMIVGVTHVSETASKYMYLAEVRVTDGNESRFSSNQWQKIGRLAWAGSNITVTITELNASNSQIVQISYPDGTAVQSITKDLNDYRNLSATNDGNSLVAVQTDFRSHIWTASPANFNQMKRITPGSGRFYQTSWTPDGQIIYVSEDSGNQNIWTMAVDGSRAKQLTVDPAADCYPVVSPDNQYIVFSSNRGGGAFHLYRMNRDGSNPVQLTYGNDDQYSQISSDSRFVYYTASNSGKDYLSKISIDGGVSAPVINQQSSLGAISPDGKWIVCLFLNEQTNSKWQFGVLSVDDGKLVKVLDIPTDGQWQVVKWMRDEQRVSYINAHDDLSDLWQYSLAADLPKPITHSNSSDQIFYYDWSPKDKSLVCLRGSITNDIVFLTGKEVPQ
ncbi:MAG: protein kinase [Pyrinomonadaceae bacterium]